LTFTTTGTCQKLTFLRSKGMERNELRGQGKNMPRNMKMKWNEMDGFVLVQTEGKERTAVEYSELLGTDGFGKV